MREYQRKKKNKYLLPHNVYMQTLYAIRDYERLKSESEMILDSSPPSVCTTPGGKGGVSPSSPTETKALKIAEYNAKITAVSGALKSIPQEYRRGVLNNILHGARYPIDADIRTYQRNKQKFIYFAAVNLKFI